MDRLFEKFQQNSQRAKYIRIRLTEPCVDVDSLIKSLSEELSPLTDQDPVLFHIDTSGVSIRAFIPAETTVLWLAVLENQPSRCLKVRSGLEELLFHLLVLGCLSDSHGNLWRRNEAHLITVEVLKPNQFLPNRPKEVEIDLLVLYLCSDVVSIPEDK